MNQANLSYAQWGGKSVLSGPGGHIRQNSWFSMAT